MEEPMKPWQHMPQQRQQQIQVQVDLKKDIVVCECGGIGLLMPGAFLPKNQPLISAEPQVFAANVILCNTCGQRLFPPFTTAGDIKEAS